MIAPFIALLLLAGADTPAAPDQAAGLQPAPQATSTAEAEAKARAKNDPLVCKSETQPDSRVRTRVCLPRSQREARAENHQAAWSAMQSRPTISIERGN